MPKTSEHEIEIDGEQIIVTVQEITMADLKPVDPREKKIFRGVTPKLNMNEWCKCKGHFDNQICKQNPYRKHSLIVFCPRCGCVTQD